MARFERSTERKNKRDFKDSRPRRDNRSKRSFEEVHREGRRNPRRDSDNRGRKRREVEMTKVICSSCGKECEVPFKPTSTKPVYCDECFAKKNKSSSNDLSMINEKLNKIMKALKIE
jgi:CxxC-x17-CxxC domain-containing protein